MCDIKKLNNITAENHDQGICGFVSSLCLVFSNQKTAENEISKWINGGEDAERRKWYINEIKVFLTYLEKNNSLLSNTVDFTKSFKNYNNFDIIKYRKKLENLLTSKNILQKPNGNGFNDAADYSIALPYKAVQEYLKVRWGVRTSKNDCDKPEKIPKNSIVGLHRQDSVDNEVSKKNEYLKHFVYVDNKGKISSWGEEYESINSLVSAKGYCFNTFGVIQLI